MLNFLIFEYFVSQIGFKLTDIVTQY